VTDASSQQDVEAGLSGRIAHWKLVVGGLLAIALFASPWWAPKVLRQLAFFRVRKVEILGARYTPPAEVLLRLRVDTLRSVWDPTDPLVARVAAHPQVESVTITRRLPGTLVVELIERRPVALVASPDGLRAIDAHGRRLPLDPSRTPVDAPIVSAAPRDTAVYHLLGVMQREAPRLYARLSTVRRASDDEIVFQIAGLTVRALTTVTLARLTDIDPVERDLERRQLRAA
jgi:cell division protein FtsQ